MSEKRYMPLQPSYIHDQLFQTGYNKMIDIKEGNILVTEDGKRYLVVRANVAIINPDVLTTIKQEWELRYVDMADHTVCGKPTKVTKIYNSVDDLIAEKDPVWERKQWINMTEVEDKILCALDADHFKYIVRGPNGALYLFRSTPIRNTYTGGCGFIVPNNVMSHRVDFCMFNRWFRFIKSHKCYSIKDLQEGTLTEVELESEYKKGDDKYGNY